MNELTILSALVLKHLICDYPLQTPYQFMNKGIYGHPGGLLHVGIHAVGTVIALVFFTSFFTAIALALLDAFIHYHIDWAKNHINRHFDLKPTGGAAFWFTFGLDQYLHQMTYILLTYLWCGNMNNARIDLQNIPLFAQLEPAALSALEPLLTPVHFAPGQTILIEGEPGDCCYIVLTGRVKFLTQTAGKEALLLGEAGKGDYFGELSMFTGAPRAARVVALEATQTLALKFDVFEGFLLAHPHAAIDVLKTLARRLQKSDVLLQEISAENVNQVNDARMTVGERISDGFANLMGSWSFIIWQSILLILWVGWNAIAGLHNMMHPDRHWALWDEYPFIFLNLALSFQAAYAAPIIMMSQNRSAKKDRLAAEIDHDVNVKSELQIRQLMQRLDDLEKSVNYKLN